MDELRSILACCTLCPRLCRVNRLAGELGRCRVGAEAVIASAGPHFGEESCLVGRGGSGTIFLTGCNLGCVFCQNGEISDGLEGETWDTEELADGMLRLQEMGCHNVNWVTPTHQMPAIFEALAVARERGLTVPGVFNCGGYERVEVLRMIEGRVEIYMPDFKFWSPASAERYADAADYPERAREAVREMHRQVGDLAIRDGVARRGLLVRHLVMPGGVEESKAILDFLAREVSGNTYVNVMDQYRPAHRAREFPEIARRITAAEYGTVREHAAKLGLRLAE